MSFISGIMCLSFIAFDMADILAMQKFGTWYFVNQFCEQKRKKPNPKWPVRATKSFVRAVAMAFSFRSSFLLIAPS